MKINRCPRCDSARIGFNTLSAVWVCKSCGYHGPVVVHENIGGGKQKA